MEGRIDLRAPMLIPLTGLVSGILFSNLGANILTGISLMLIGIVVYEILQHIDTGPVQAYRIRYFQIIWPLLLFAGAGVTAADFSRTRPIASSKLDESEIAVGRVRDISYTTGGDVAKVRISAIIDTAGRVMNVSPVGVLIHGDNLGVDIDDIISFPCELERIVDDVASFNSGYARHMESKGILYTTRVNDNDVTINGHDRTLHGMMVNCRYDLEQFIEKSALAKPTQNFLLTLLLGDKSYLSHDLRERFADAGISHMLALSGMHVSIIAGIILFLLFPFNLFGAYRWRYILCIPLLWGYALITGLYPSTVRAALMATCVMIAILLERKNSAWNALLLSVFIILLFDPSAISDIGLQLSFLCVAALIFFVNGLNMINHHDHPNIYKLVSIILTTLVATGVSWVLTSYYFGIIPTLFIPANIIVLPFLPLYVVLALLYFVIEMCGLSFTPLLWILDNGYDGLTHLVDYLGNHGSSVIHYSVPLLCVICWIGAIVFLAIWFHGKRSKTTLAISVTMTIAAIISIPVMSSRNHNDGMIIQGGSDRPHILTNIDNRTNTLTPETNAISVYDIMGYRVVVADTRAIPDSLGSCDFFVMTRSCTADLADIRRKLNPRMIVLHTTVPRKREQKLISQADSLGMRLHSIRRNAPLRIQR